MTDTVIDLNHTRTKRDLFSQSLVARIDAVISPDERKAAVDEILRDIEANPPQSEERWGRSVSASAVGDECQRRVQLNIWPTFHPDAPEPRKLPLTDKSKAIFARGHRTETLVASWLQAASFDLITHTVEGRQFGFVTAGGQIKGFADGVVRGFMPEEPVMWENKTINAKNWRATAKHGVLKQYPKYDTQVQLLKAYLELPATLFSFLNAETGDLYFELMPFDQVRAQRASDRAVDILKATRAGDLLPKAGASGEGFPCKWCDFREECWG